MNDVLGDIWTNTTKMCYVPPYCQPAEKNQARLREAFSLFAQSPPLQRVEQEARQEGPAARGEPSFDSVCVAELTAMENDFKRWQKLMFSAYQSQAQLFFKVSPLL